MDNENIIHIHLPWLLLSSGCSSDMEEIHKIFFVANIMIHNDQKIWNTQIIYVKETEENKKSYIIDYY